MHLRYTLLVGALAVGCSQEAPKREDPTATPIADFAKRVDAYIALRKTLTDSVGDLDPTRSQAEIASRALTLCNAIIAARPNARQGDIFTPDVSTILATLIKEEYSRRADSVIEQREDQQDELTDFEPKVNMVYPTTYPLATFPPRLLALLPRLPEQVEYRIVRDAIILRDIEANLIVDFMTGAVPPQGG